MKTTRRSRGSRFIALLTVMAFPVGASAQEVTSRIAYIQSDSDGDAIYVSDADGQNKRRIAEDTGVLVEWSPDGSRIAFTRNIGSYREIFIGSASGERTWPLSQLASESSPQRRNDHPTWSHDGSQIAFESIPNSDPNQRGIWSDIYLAGAVDGAGGPKRITNARRSETDFGQPEWSPNTSAIAFRACRRFRGTCRIGTMQPDGSSKRYLTGNRVWATAPEWSADGNQLIYLKGRLYGSSSLIVMNSDGTRKRKVAGDVLSAGWRSDTSLFFTRRGRGGRQHVYAVNTDGTDLKRLLAGDNGTPNFRQSDGASTFVRVIDGQVSLVVGDIDAANYTPILSGQRIYYPKWSDGI